MAAVNELEGGNSRGFRVDVGPDGGGRTQPGDSVTHTDTVLVGPGSVTLADERDGRRAIYIQNPSDATVLHVRLEDAPASTSDYAVYPHETFQLPPGVTYTGVITGISSGAPPISVVVIEFYLVPEVGTM